jgi:autotransporter passenger strand-loop-strand repeat protein
MYVLSGGVAQQTTAGYFGFEYVSSGGVASGAVASSGGYENVRAGGLGIGTVVSNGGYEWADGVTLGVVVSSGGIEIVRSGGVASDTVVSSGGYEGVWSGGVASDTVIEGGALELLLNGTASGAITFGTAAPGKLEIAGTTMPIATIGGFAVGDSIDLESLPFAAGDSASFDPGAHVLTVSAGGSTYALQFDPAQDFSGETFMLSGDTNSGTLLTPQELCFCRGTRILTGLREVPVEDLEPGDTVVTLAGLSKPIKWIGYGRRRIGPTTQDARPVIVREGALADRVPNHDLRLTRAHSLYLEGMLVPVEFLINGKSILWDQDTSEVELYHIELDSHDVLIANGAPAESFRDDGNRHLFDNVDQPSCTAANTPWVAPVVTEGPKLDALWRRLQKRCGCTLPPLCDDPDLHLVVRGQRIDRYEVMDGMYPFQGTYRFWVPHRPSTSLCIISRSVVPALIGIHRDPRCLGVAIRSVVLRDSNSTIELWYDSAWLSVGFHGPEHSGGFRWTDGQGVIPAECLALFSGAFEITVEIACTTKYPADQNIDGILRDVA